MAVFCSVCGFFVGSLADLELFFLVVGLCLVTFCRNRAKQVCGYLLKMKHAIIRIHMEEPDYLDLPKVEFDCCTTVYGNVKEIVPDDIPEPLGRPVKLTMYVDANLFHDMMMGHTVTGILHLINQTPFELYCKKQATVKTAPYRPKFSSGWAATEQVHEHFIALRYLGVPICYATFFFGDNKSVVDSSMIPHARLHKRHTVLSYHPIQEAIVLGSFNFITSPAQATQWTS